MFARLPAHEDVRLCVYADIVIAVKGDLPLTEAHEVAEKVHDDIEEQFPEIKHCMVHVDPADEVNQSD